MNETEPTDNRHGTARATLRGAAMGAVGVLAAIGAWSLVAGDDPGQATAALAASAPVPMADSDTSPAEMAGEMSPMEMSGGMSQPPMGSEMGSVMGGAPMGAPMAGEMGSASADDAADVPAAGELDCEAYEAEQYLREEQGLIDWEALYPEYDEDEYDRLPIYLDEFSYDVAGPDEDIVFGDFTEPVSPQDLPTERLVEVVGRCWERGLLD